MTLGYSGAYAVNETRFLLQPTTAKPSARTILGIDGGGHPIYPSVREFEIHWELAHPNDVKQLIDAFDTVSNTGTITFDLPEWGADDYKFVRYSGCTMQEPTVGDYFNGYITDVRLIIMKVNT